MTVAAPDRGAELRSEAGQALRTAVLVVLGVGLLSLHLLGEVGLAIGFLASVGLLVVAWALVVDPPGRLGVSVIGVLVAVLVLAFGLFAGTGANSQQDELLLVGAVVALVAAMGLQIARRPPRPGVVASMASGTTLGMIVVAGATLVTLVDEAYGKELTQLFLLVAGATLVVGRLLDAVLPRPALRTGLPRGLAGLVVGAAAGIATSSLISANLEVVSTGAAFLVGIGITAAVIVTDLVAIAVTIEHRRGGFGGPVLNAVTPLLASVPVAVVLYGWVVS